LSVGGAGGRQSHAPRSNQREYSGRGRDVRVRKGCPLGKSGNLVTHGYSCAGRMPSLVESDLGNVILNRTCALQAFLWTLPVIATDGMQDHIRAAGPQPAAGRAHKVGAVGVTGSGSGDAGHRTRRTNVLVLRERSMQVSNRCILRKWRVCDAGNAPQILAQWILMLLRQVNPAPGARVCSTLAGGSGHWTRRDSADSVAVECPAPLQVLRCALELSD